VVNYALSTDLRKVTLTVIPTVFKSNIPRTHSFPISAELHSAALSSVPQLELLKLEFYGLWSSLFKDKSQVQLGLRVNHISFRQNQYSSKSFVAQGFYDEAWEIIVYPVLGDKKSEVKRLLLAEGLPKVYEWLSAKRSPTWLEGRRTLSILFDEGRGP
jgi:hypothetical protein